MCLSGAFFWYELTKSSNIGEHCINLYFVTDDLDDCLVIIILILWYILSLSGMWTSMMFINLLSLLHIWFTLSPDNVSVRWLMRFSNSKFVSCWDSMKYIISSDGLNIFVSYSYPKDSQYYLHRSSCNLLDLTAVNAGYIHCRTIAADS